MKEVLEQTIKEYEAVYSTVQTQTLGVAIQTCILRNMQLGCCEYIRRKFGDEKCDELKIWSMDKCSMYGRWCELPLSCKTHKDLITAFSVRIFKLNSLKWILEKK